MRRLFSVAVFAVLVLGCAPMTEAQNTDLSAYAWKSRLMVVVTENTDDPAFTAQMTDIEANWNGYEDRDLVLFVFSDDRLVETRPTQDVTLSGDAVRKKLFLPDTGFGAALIGLDTSVALRSAEPILACELFREIDGMPIRQREMRERGRTVDCRPSEDG